MTPVYQSTTKLNFTSSNILETSRFQHYANESTKYRSRYTGIPDYGNGSTNFTSDYGNGSTNFTSDYGNGSTNFTSDYGNGSTNFTSEVGGNNYTDNETIDYIFYYDYSFFYDDYMYPGFAFERPVYLFVWEILVIFTFLFNIIVLSVFFRRKMFSPTILILSAIAISDSLTGLVTLPTYIMVYQSYDPLPGTFDSKDSPQTDFFLQNGIRENDSYESSGGSIYVNSSLDTLYTKNSYIEQHRHFNFNTTEFNGTRNYTHVSMTSSVGSHQSYYDTATMAPTNGYKLTKSLCRGFMISKYFLSISFHTVSIFLTLFLGIQRYLSMAHPFKAETFFSLKKTRLYCIGIFILTPFLHSYHLISEKAENGMCQWELNETGCKEGCIYLWATFVVRHFLPCCALVVFTVLFILQLRQGEKHFGSMASHHSQVSFRVKENRRISFIVTVVVIVRLIPEVPFSIFLLYNSIDKTISNGSNIHLEVNRAIHMTYEILLMLSFQANFYIYLLFNQKFRSCLLGKCIEFRRRLIADTGELYGCSVAKPSLTSVTFLRNRESVCVGENIEMKADNADASMLDAPAAEETLLVISDRPMVADENSSGLEIKLIV